VAATAHIRARNGLVLEIERLARSYGNHEVVRDLSLRVDPGERVAFWGPNGSGKTTALRCIAGTLTPTRGRITILDHEAGQLEARRLIGTSLSQERSFYLRLTGHANLVFFARLRTSSRRGAEAAVRALEEELELEDILAERVDRCSSGMVQQLAFARALLGEPPLILLDEPTRSLDRSARERIWAALESRSRSAVAIATHLDEDVERCGKRVDFPT
jgi:ABC-2 type transport system ATP-binding protein